MNPNKEYRHSHTLVWLHGLGDTAYGFVDVFLNTVLDPTPLSWKIVLLTAPERPVTLNFGYKSTSWYDIYELGSHKIDVEQLEESANFVQEIMKQEQSILE